jgi:hypothetical protein
MLCNLWQSSNRVTAIRDRLYKPGTNKELGMKMKKLNGASPNKSSSGTWLAYWEKLSGQSAYLCFGQGCINTPSVGALVQKDSLSDKKLYVIPLCQDCNKKREQDLDIWDTRTLISVDATTANGIAAVTPRSFAQWATERFPEVRVFNQARPPNG